MSAAILEGRLQVTTAWTMTVTEHRSTEPAAPSATVTVIAAGYHSMAGSWGSNVPVAIAAALTANATLYGTYAGALDSSGRMGLSVSGGSVTTFDADWTAGGPDPIVATGFQSGRSGAASYTGASAARHLWLPGCQAVLDVPQGGAGEAAMYARRSVDASVVVAPSGQSAAIDARGSTGYGVSRARIAWPALRGSKTWTAAEAVANESLERLWLDVLAPGHHVALTQETPAAGGNYSVRFVALDAGRFAPVAVGGGRGAGSLWAYSLDALVVAAS
jgi:hypothetical protein